MWHVFSELSLRVAQRTERAHINQQEDLPLEPTEMGLRI